MQKTKKAIFKYISFTVFLFLILDVFIQYQLYQRYRNDQLLSVYHQTSALRARIEKEVNSSLLLINGLADYVSYHPELSRSELESYCQGMLFRSKLIKNIGVAPDYVVKFVYPIKGNEAVLGLDYRLSPTQWEQVKEVYETGKMVVAGPLALVQGGQGLIGRAPVFVRSNEYFWGIVSAVIDVDQLFVKAGLNKVADLKIAVRGVDGKGAEGAVFYGDPDIFDPDSSAVTMQVTLSSGSWQIAALPAKGWGVIPPDSFMLHGIMILLVLSICFSIYKIVTKNAEVEMVRTNLSEAQSIARLGNWSMDLVNGKIWWSDETYNIFGLVKGEYTPSKRGFFSVLVHRDDRRVVSDTYIQSMKSGEDYSLDHRIVRPDGEVRYVSERGKFSYDDDGNPVRVYGTIHDITDRKLMEKKLRESKIRFDHVTNKLSRQFVFFSHTIDGEFVRLSEGITHLGYGSPEIGLGRRWTELFDFSPESVIKANETNARLLSGEIESSEFEMEFTTPDGQERCMSVYAYLAYDFELEENVFEGVVLDITERKAREERLKILTQAIENAPVSVVITDTEGDITYVNPYFSKETGYSYEEAIGQNPRVLKSGEHDDLFYKDMWDTISSGRTWRGDIINKKKDGSFYWEYASISPVYNPKGELVSYVAVKEDISDQKELERLKSDVDLIMRHDLKTPLNGIIGLPGLLRMDDNLTKQQHELLKTIENSGTNMLHMIDMSLDMFKMETGKYEYYPLEVDALGVARQVVDNSRSIISASRVGVEVLVDGTPDFMEKLLVWGEERLIYSLLSGLLTNAIEASPAGEDIIIEFLQNENTIISVSNKGVVPLQVRERFFQKYVTYGKEDGTGLGTYSAKLMSDAMRYGIEMQTFDELNETKIIVTIPRERPESRGGSNGM
ncbi:PAS domain S-box protein [Desulfovibrio sp. JC010]|uniref:PAS domain S-box protein n=1 Tax=Desulfovibrio sp. JC010 TaxID=2593641 RepID=UPI0013D58C49|nr:PAS domain S-box protein [Desulfovibrio sp. JC010]NDV26240.1 PAS domain S-box protein [Desulfovibrio sp. JC010]